MAKRYIRWIYFMCVVASILLLGEISGWFDGYRYTRNKLRFERKSRRNEAKNDLISQIWSNSSNETVDLNKTKIFILDKKAFYEMGDEIKIRIILYNKNGERRQSGGDAIKARMFEQSINASAAGHIEDHENGVYTATLRCLWTGSPSIRVYLHYTREVAEVADEFLKSFPTVRYTLAVYNNEKVGRCHPFRRSLPSSRQVCNLAHLNGGMSWYCEKPEKGNNSCDDIRHFKYGSSKTILSLRRMFNVSRGPLGLFRITVLPSKRDEEKCKGWCIQAIHVRSGPFEHTMVECQRYNRANLWNLKPPSGFFFKNHWLMLHCKQPSLQDLGRILRNRRLILYGDSTVRQWFVDLKEMLNCELVSETWTNPKWIFNSKAYCANINFTIELVFHSLPGNIGLGKLRFNSISKHLLNYLGQKEVIILIHLQSHFNSYHENVFVNRIRHIHASVKKVLEANTKSTIFIKGFHLYWSVIYYKIKIYKAILTDTFKDIRDKVIYLDNEESAVAKHVIDVHPDSDVVRAMVNQMLAYIPSLDSL